MPGKEAKKSPKKEAILDAAERSFQEEGYDNASMDRIAEAAGASKRTVYNHFPSKEALFKAVVNRGLDQVFALKQIPYDPERSLSDQLSDFADAKMAMTQEPSWLGMTKVVLGVFIRDPELAREIMEKADAHEDALVAWLKAAVRDKRIKATNVELAAQVFWAMMMGAFTWPAVFHEVPDPKAAKEMKAELIKTFLSRYGA